MTCVTPQDEIMLSPEEIEAGMLAIIYRLADATVEGTATPAQVVTALRQPICLAAAFKDLADELSLVCPDPILTALD